MSDNCVHDIPLRVRLRSSGLGLECRIYSNIDGRLNFIYGYNISKTPRLLPTRSPPFTKNNIIIWRIDHFIQLKFFLASRRTMSRVGGRIISQISKHENYTCADFSDFTAKSGSHVSTFAINCLRRQICRDDSGLYLCTHLNRPIRVVSLFCQRFRFRRRILQLANLCLFLTQADHCLSTFFADTCLIYKLCVRRCELVLFRAMRGVSPCRLTWINRQRAEAARETPLVTLCQVQDCSLSKHDHWHA